MKEIFETELDFYFRNRRDKARRNKNAPYGKIICWHDYTTFWRETNIAGEFKCQCVKCGKLKWTLFPPVEQLPNNINN